MLDKHTYTWFLSVCIILAICCIKNLYFCTRYRTHKKSGIVQRFSRKDNWEEKKSGKQDTLMSEVIRPHLHLLRVRQEMRWLYHCCHFVFGWLGSFLSWIGFADDGAGEPHREIFHLSRRAPLFNMQHLCRGERSKMAAPWRMTAESAQNLGRGRL